MPRIIIAGASEASRAQLNRLLDQGNTQAARTVESALYKLKGTTAVKSALTSYWKPKYQEAYQQRNRTELSRIVKLLKAMGYSDASISKWKTVESSGGSTSGFGSGTFGSSSSKKYSRKKSTSGFGSSSFGGGW